MASGHSPHVPEDPDINIFIILMCRGPGVQPSGTRRCKLIRNNKNNKFLKKRANLIYNK